MRKATLADVVPFVVFVAGTFATTAVAYYYDYYNESAEYLIYVTMGLTLAATIVATFLIEKEKGNLRALLGAKMKMPAHL
jgi:hypothetical protein